LGICKFEVDDLYVEREVRMLQIKPFNNHSSKCPYCQCQLENKKILWQGMFVCIQSVCFKCQKNIVEDLPIGHGNHSNYQIDIDENKIFGNPDTANWLGNPLLLSLKSPKYLSIDITTEFFKPCEKALVLNCIDFLYGHCLLKLLNAERHLKENSDCGLILIIPRFLRWMAPEGVSEIWTLNLPLHEGQSYYLSFDLFIQEQSKRFKEIYISKAYSHPSEFNISNFTKVEHHDFLSMDFRVTFIWREDRLWSEDHPVKSLRLWKQNRKVVQVLRKIKENFPTAKLTIVGLGDCTSFPSWIDDMRVKKFTLDNERCICEIYHESRVVFGVHGSNMLLPSAHAGMTLNLMPPERLDNFAQDILYQENDPRIAAFRYRYISIDSHPWIVAKTLTSMLIIRPWFLSEMTADKKITR
jgi:glycosyltransferase involved in cell wall biosynthesis